MTEERTAGKGDWDNDFSDNEDQKSGDSQGERKKTEYMSMGTPGDYDVRLVGPYVKCRKQFIPYRATCQDDEKDTNPAWQAGFFPSKRFAINVIDKTGLEEGALGTLKVLEKGTEVFKHFANYKAVFGKDPAGKEGPDFRITVKIPKDGNGEYIKLKTEYSVMHLKDAPFTSAEVAMIKEQKLWPLSKIYKSTPPEKMMEMWSALPDEKKIPKKKEDRTDAPKKSSTQSAPVKEKMESAPADDDDLFGDKDSGAAESGEMF